MSGIFDGITQPTTTFGALTGTAARQPHPTAAATVAASEAPTAASARPSPVPAAAAHVAVAPEPANTGLLAAVSPDDFIRLVAEYNTRMVLTSPVRVVPPSDSRGRPAAAVQHHRYVAAMCGTVFACTSPQTLGFGTGVRLVPCLGVLYDGRPLGRDEAAL